MSIRDWFAPARVVRAHCDLPCGVYDPAQARVEGESVRAIQERYRDADSQKAPGESVEDYRARCLVIKEQRADLVKHHLWVLWTDYFKPEHLDKHANLHEAFWKATKLAGDCKRSTDPADGQRLIKAIDQIAAVFWATKGKEYKAA